jgi:hypothetical protein
MKSEVKDRTREMADRTKEQARGFAQQARERASTAAVSGKDRAAEQLTGVARAFRGTTSQLRENNVPFADGVESLADRVDQWAGYLRDNDLDRLRMDVERFARQRPAVLIGAAFTLGLLGARFLKSSERRLQNEYDRDSYGSRSLAAGGYSPEYAAGGSYGSQGTYGGNAPYGSGTGRGAGGASASGAGYGGGAGYGQGYGSAYDTDIDQPGGRSAGGSNAGS